MTACFVSLLILNLALTAFLCGAGERRIGFGFGSRQFDDDLRAAFGPIGGHNAASVVLDDAVAGAEPESGAVAHRLGGVERIEDARQVFDTGPAVVECQHYLSILGRG